MTFTPDWPRFNAAKNNLTNTNLNIPDVADIDCIIDHANYLRGRELELVNKVKDLKRTEEIRLGELAKAKEWGQAGELYQQILVKACLQLRLFRENNEGDLTTEMDSDLMQIGFNAERELFKR